MFTEILTAFRNLQAAGPQTYQDLIEAVNAFAVKHQATPDVFFEVLFNHLDESIKTRIGEYQYLDDVEAQELLYLERFPSRPLICAVLPATAAENCRIVFKEPSDIEAIMGGRTEGTVAILNMLAVFATDNMFPGYKYNNFSAFGGTGKLNWVRSNLCTLNGPDEGEAELQMQASEALAAQEHLDDLLTQRSFAQWQQESSAFICKYASNCELPNRFLIDFMNSPAAEAALARLKANANIWRAYDATVPDVQLDVGTNDISDPTNATALLSYESLIQQAEAIVATKNLNCKDCDVFEHALTKMYDAGEKPMAACQFRPTNENYATGKRDFLVQISISKEAMQRMIANINSRNPSFPNAAVLIQDFPATMLLSYAFVMEDFLPRLQELLDLNPELVAEMQAIVNAKRAEHLESIDEGKDAEEDESHESEDADSDSDPDPDGEQSHQARIRRIPSM